MINCNSDRKKTLSVCAALVAATVGAYWPVTRHQFVNWDDDVHVYKNDHVRTGLTWDNFVWSWGIHGPSQWHPLSWWSHQLDCSLFGADQRAAGWHHAISLALHLAASLALFAALKRMTGAIWPSALVAALFALHPLSVQSVAWIAERRNVLSGLFGALTMWTYAGYARRVTLARYAFVIICFVLGLLSKPTLVTLPCVLLLLDYWPLCRIDRLATRMRSAASTPPCPPRSISWLLVEKAPMFALATLSVVLSYFCHRTAVWSLAQFPASSRFASGALSYVMYLRNMLWPWNLSPEYPLPRTFPFWHVAAAVMAVFAITAITVSQASRRPYLVVGWLWYLGMLFPLIGPLRFGIDAWLWDHYTYLPLTGVYIAVAWSLCDLVRTSHQSRVVVAIVAVLVVALCAVLTHRQVGYWRDSTTLFNRAIAVDPAVPDIQNNLGVALADLGRFDEAVAHYQEVLRIKPNDAGAHNNWGYALNSLGRPQEAVGHYREALRIKPDYAEAHNNWGSALALLGRFDEAVAHYQEALRLKPNYAEAHSNWGSTLALLGRFDEAVAHDQEALRIKPNLADAHFNCGNALAGLGRFDEAVAHYQEAVRIKPNDAEAHNNWGSALALLGRFDEAVAHYQEALRIKPNYAEVHNDWGLALAVQGRLQNAVEHFQQALRLKPNLTSARDNLRQVQALLHQKNGSSD